MRKKDVSAILLVFFVVNLFSCKNSSINNKILDINSIEICISTTALSALEG